MLNMIETTTILPVKYSDTFILFMKYYIFIAIIICILYVLYYQGKKLLFTDMPTTEEETKPNPEPSHPGTLQQLPEIYYVYWTGGYDSTYRLCEMLLIERKIVQPLYVTLALDNDCTTEETCNKLWVRRNRDLEKKAMVTIRKTLEQQYPNISRTKLLPTIYIDTDIVDDKFNQTFESKFYADNLWPEKRRKHQYLFLSKFAYYNKIPIDIGVLGLHKKSKFSIFLAQELKAYTDASGHKNYKISGGDHFLSYIRFPLYGKTKKTLLLRAKKYSFDTILKLTWSCWFPNSSGVPCGKCPMCKERIIGHPKTDNTHKPESSIQNPAILTT